MTFFETLNELISSGQPAVAVTVVDTAGSVPNDRGARMLVTPQGLYYGTVGGGRVEKKAIDEAMEMLAEGTESTRFRQWQLNRDVGMTCGGAVKLFFEAFNAATWDIAIFGAGHVANAVVGLLSNLDCRILCFDPRAEWIERLPKSPKVQAKISPDMPGEVKGLPDDAFVLLISTGHATDLPILIEILRTRKFPFLGAIGSRAKANILQRDLEEAGIPEELRRSYHCPIGLPLGTNHPQEIAVSVAAQLLQVRDRLRGVERDWKSED